MSSMMATFLILSTRFLLFLSSKYLCSGPFPLFLPFWSKGDPKIIYYYIYYKVIYEWNSYQIVPNKYEWMDIVSLYSLYLFLSISFFLSLSLYLFLSISFSLSLSLYLFLSIFFISLSIKLFISFYQVIYLFLSSYLSLSLLCVFLSLSLFF